MDLDPQNCALAYDLTAEYAQWASYGIAISEAIFFMGWYTNQPEAFFENMVTWFV